MLFDFYEMLGRGIIAARTDRPEEARQYLELAAQMEPENPRVWLWMAAVTDTLPEKRQYLQKALALDPHQVVTQVLLERIERHASSIEQSSSALATFTCPYCGGRQHFDPDRAGLVCEYCKKLEALDLITASPSASSVTTALAQDAGNWDISGSHSSCMACGAQITLLAGQATSHCPFCDSHNITLQSATPGLFSPAGIILFRRHTDDIFGLLIDLWHVRKDALDGWLASRQLTISPLYLPFWDFEGRVQIRCNFDQRAASTTYSPTERVFIKGDRMVGEPWYECLIADTLVYAGSSIPDSAVAKIPPYDLQVITPYLPQLLTGWQAEIYQVAFEDAAVVAHKRLRDQAFANAARRGLFMDSSRMLSDEVMVLDQTYKLILLPVWIVRRFLSGKIYVTLINGQTGQVARRNKSWLRSLKSIIENPSASD